MKKKLIFLALFSMFISEIFSFDNLSLVTIKNLSTGGYLTISPKVIGKAKWGAEKHNKFQANLENDLNKNTQIFMIFFGDDGKTIGITGSFTGEYIDPKRKDDIGSLDGGLYFHAGNRKVGKDDYKKWQWDVVSANKIQLKNKATKKYLTANGQNLGSAKKADSDASIWVIEELKLSNINSSSLRSALQAFNLDDLVRIKHKKTGTYVTLCPTSIVGYTKSHVHRGYGKFSHAYAATDRNDLGYELKLLPDNAGTSQVFKMTSNKANKKEFISTLGLKFEGTGECCDLRKIRTSFKISGWEKFTSFDFDFYPSYTADSPYAEQVDVKDDPKKSECWFELVKVEGADNTYFIMYKDKVIYSSGTDGILLINKNQLQAGDDGHFVVEPFKLDAFMVPGAEGVQVSAEESKAVDPSQEPLIFKEEWKLPEMMSGSVVFTVNKPNPFVIAFSRAMQDGTGMEIEKIVLSPSVSPVTYWVSVEKGQDTAATPGRMGSYVWRWVIRWGTGNTLGQNELGSKTLSTRGAPYMFKYFGFGGQGIPDSLSNILIMPMDKE